MRGATAKAEAIQEKGIDFNPRAPCGARPDLIGTSTQYYQFQSTRPMRGATSLVFPNYRKQSISIHAPHAGRDQPSPEEKQTENHFNPRAPCGARPTRTQTGRKLQNISIHAPHAGRDHRQGQSPAVRDISIHAPHAGRDSKSIQNYFTHFCDKRQFLDNFTQNAAF